MAEFNPTAGQSPTAPSFVGSSKGIDADRVRADSSVADLFEGLGTGIVQGINVIDQGIQDQIQDELIEGVDFINREFGVDDAAITNQFRGDVFGDRPVPGQLRDSARALEGLQAQVQSGQLKESHYWARAQALLRQVRGRYPGYREEIDNMIRSITGTDPANALRRAQMQEWGQDATDAGALEKKRMSLIESNHDIIVAAAGPDYEQKDYWTLNKDIARYRARDGELKRNQAEMVDAKNKNELTEDHALRNYKTELDHQVSTLFSSGLGKEIKELVKVAQLQKAKGEWSAQEAQQLSALFASFKGQVSEVFSAVDSQPWGDSDNPDATYRATVSSEAMAAAKEEAMLEVKFLEESIFSKDFGSINAQASWMEAENLDIARSLRTKYPAVKKWNAMREQMGESMGAFAAAHPDMAPVMNELIGSMLADTQVKAANGEEYPRMTDHLDEVTAAGDTSPDFAGEWTDNQLKVWESYVNLIGSDEELSTEMMATHVEYLFGEANLGVLSKMDGPSRQQYFMRVASPKVTKKMLELKKDAPEAYDTYQKWVINSFQAIFKDSLDTINSRIPNPDVFQIDWNPETSKFTYTVNPGLTPIQLRTITAAGEVRHLETAIRTLNEGISTVAPIIKDNEMDVGQQLTHVFRKMGFDPHQPPAQEGIVDVLVNAVNRQIQIMGEDLKDGSVPIVGRNAINRGLLNIWDTFAPFSPQFLSPEERRGAKEGALKKETPSNPALDQRLSELRNEYPEAVATLQARQTPPKFEELGWLVRTKLASEAKKLGVTPQEVINRAHEMANAKTAPVLDPQIVQDNPRAKASRGVRNNNPGNIEYGKFTRKRGATGSDGRFATFSTPEAGIEALHDLLGVYQSQHGLTTVHGMINRWAPSFENNSQAYVNRVASAMGIDPHEPFDVKSNPVLAAKMVAAIIKHENGYQPYTPQQILYAVGFPEEAQFTSYEDAPQETKIKLLEMY